MSTQTDPNRADDGTVDSRAVEPSTSVSHAQSSHDEGGSHEEHDSEGNSIAAWTAVVIMLVAFAVGTIAFMFNVPIVVWASLGLVIVGLIVGQILKRLGYGVGGHRYVPKAHN